MRVRALVLSLAVGCALLNASFMHAVEKRTARSYSTRGTITEVRDGIVILKDKFGQEFEYDVESKSAAPVKGQKVKIHYTLKAVRIDPDSDSN